MTKPQNKNASDSRKKAPTVICNKCKQKVDPKSTIQCSLCKKNFEYDCIGHSEKLRRLKNTATRKNWRCKKCEQKQTLHSTPISSVSLTSTSKKPIPPNDVKDPISKDKIICHETPRKDTNTDIDYEVNVLTSNSFQSLSDQEMYDQTQTSIISRLNSSCPDVGKINLEEKLEELEKRNRDLQEKLLIAESEIDNLHLENSELKKILFKQESKAKYLADIVNHSSSKKNITLRNKQKKLKSTQLVFSLDGSRNPEPDCDDSTSAPSIVREANHLANVNNSRASCTTVDNSQVCQSVDVSKGEAPNNTKPNIYIIGDQQVKGLTEQLLKSRSKGWNDCYKVTGIVKPFALSPQILNSCTSLYDSLTDDDILILSVGCNDKNPYLIMSSLCNMLCNLKKCKIFFFSVEQNCYLNVNRLNSEINSLIKNYSNCTFINIDLLVSDYPLGNMTARQLIIFKINIEIDYDKYKIMYFTNFKKIKDSFSL